MAGFLARRFLSVVFVLWAMTVMVFAIVHILPGSVAHMILGEYATNAAIAEMEERLGLNLPLYEQYWRWFSGLMRGDFGQSLTMERPVGPVILEALGRSAILASISIVLVAIIGIALGIHSATHVNSWSDRGLTLMQYFFIAVPEFFWCILVIIFFAVWLGWLPVGGRFPATLLPPSGSGFYLVDSLRAGNLQQFSGTLRHLILPAATLGLLLSGIFTNALRLNLRRALGSDYVEAARSRGLSERRVVLRHALPNALLPVLTITGITVASLIGGALLIEVTYSWPGIAFRLQEAIAQRDYPLVQGIVVVVAALVVLVTVAVDLLVALLDPRIRF